MANKKEFRRRFYMRLLGRPVTVGSIGASAIALTGAVLASHPLGWLIAAGVAGATAVGTAGFNVWFRADKVAREINENMQLEMERARKKDLDDLAELLAEDNDPSDDQMLRDLRALIDRFRGDHSWMQQMNPSAVSDMQHAAQELFDACVFKLRKSVELRNKASELSRNVGRPLWEGRRVLLQQVEQGVGGLGELYALVEKRSVDRMAGRAVGSDDIAGVLDKFQAILEVDQRVEERLGQSQADDSRYEQYLEP
jgi:hypothetical protein